MAELINEKDTLNQGRKKLNEAIKDSNKAKIDSSEAKTKAEHALSKSESTQEQLNQVVIDGDSSVEAAQARVNADNTKTYETLKDRLDTEYEQVTTQLAETADEISENTRKITEVNAAKLVPNDERPLDIPTYDGSNQTTHPDVLYFPNGWNGYKYWLCHTPYPYSNIKLENPSIVASNDLITWDEPVPNPIVPLDSDDPGSYNSDGNIFMVGNTMELWWRLFEYGKIKIYRKKSTDGVNWSEAELLFDEDDFELVRSQSVRYIDGKYCMWYNFGSGGGTGTYYNKYAESVDGKTWENVRILDIEIDDEYYWWHPAVIVTDKGYELISHCIRKDGEGSSIFYSHSKDNINFSKAIKIIDCSDDVTRIDHRLYRPSPVLVDDKYYVFYGTTSADREFRVALTKGKTLLELISDNVSKPSMIVSAENAYKPDDPLESYPNHAITYTRVRGEDSLLWPSGRSGTLITDRVTAIPKQIYRAYGAGEYERFVNTRNEWLEFNPIPEFNEFEGNVDGVTIAAHSSHKVTIPVNGLNYNYKVVANPKSPLESGLSFMATVQNNTVALTFFNVTETEKSMASRDWVFTIIK